MKTTTTAPDAALLWARENAARYYTDEPETKAAILAGTRFIVECEENAAAFRAGQSHARRADAGLLAALEQTREMLSLVEQAICDALCPAQWKAGEEPPHCDLHKDILACLAKHEPVRDAARAAIAAAKGQSNEPI